MPAIIAIICYDMESMDILLYPYVNHKKFKETKRQYISFIEFPSRIAARDYAGCWRGARWRKRLRPLILQPNGGKVRVCTTSESDYIFDVNGTFRAVGAAYLNSTLEVTSYATANRFYTGYDSGLANSISCSNWFRSYGGTGWYNETYVAGITSDSNNIVRTYGTNKFKVYNTEADSIYTLGGVKADGNIVAKGEITAYSASDRRLKENIRPLTNSLSIILSMNPVSYNWNNIAKELNPLKSNNKDFGLVAQELELIVPELVHTIYGGQYKSIDYVKIIPHLICAIKQLKSEIDNLKN